MNIVLLILDMILMLKARKLFILGIGKLISSLFVFYFVKLIGVSMSSKLGKL